ncbi:MAG: RHS repeat-associated core domain-containing protein, partial [Bacteroidia bacterium]|nr:RHS repeat-associated core domain-containing protein [Bacteroidia bacterium]
NMSSYFVNSAVKFAPGNLATVQSAQNLYGGNYGGLENYFTYIRNYFGQGLYDQITAGFMQQSSVYTDSLRLEEWHMYGSSRIGIYQTNKAMAQRTVRIENGVTTQLSNTHIEQLSLSRFYTERGSKRYELTNHLGNVLTVVTDKKMPVCSGTSVSYFIADVVSATDYSPFGAPLAERTWQGGEYRYGFNGKEKDNETYGTGDAYDFGARIYDSRLGRWMSVDPQTSTQPYVSPFRAFANNPIVYADPDGEREYITILIKEKDGSTTMMKVLVSKKVMTDGVKHQIDGLNPASLFYDNEVRYYDFETVVNYNRKEDGTLEFVSQSSPQLIKDNNNDEIEDVQLREYGDYFDLPKEGSNITKYDYLDLEGEGGYMGSGIMFYSGTGGVSPTKWKVKEDGDVVATDIENVLIAFGALKGPSTPKIKELLGTADFISTINGMEEARRNIQKENVKSYQFKCMVCGTLTNDTSATQAKDKNVHQDFQINPQYEKKK